MTHKGTATLETKRLTLRRFEPTDAEAMFYNWLGDENVTRYARQQSCASVADAATECRTIVAAYQSDDFYYWAIVPRNAAEPIGRVNVSSINEPILAATISFMLGAKWQGNGYVTEALNAVVRFLFESVKFNRIEGRNDPRNPASERVMTKCGFQYEGLLRQGGRNGFGLVDCNAYAILAEDYFAKQKSLGGNVGAAFDIRPIDEATRPLVTAFIDAHWCGTDMLIRGEVIDMTAVDGYALVENGELTGAVTYIVRGDTDKGTTVCEITSIDSTVAGRGVGTRLIETVAARARELGCSRLRLMTTNDNLNAIGFYQKRGFEIVGINLGAIDKERADKPSIPLIGQNGIPMHHEIEFSKNLKIKER